LAMRDTLRKFIYSVSEYVTEIEGDAFRLEGEPIHTQWSLK